MPICTQCGTQVEGDGAFCSYCGEPLSAADSKTNPHDAGGTTENQQANSQTQEGGGQPQQVQSGGQPKQARSGESQHQQPQGSGQQQQQQPQGEDDSGIGRREMMIGGAAVAVGGWYVFLRDSATDSPTGVIDAYVSAINSGDVDAANNLVHENAPMNRISEAEAEEMNEFSFSIVEMEVIDRDENVDGIENVQEFARVEVEMTITGELLGEEIDETDVSQITTAQTDDGEWKLWDD